MSALEPGRLYSVVTAATKSGRSPMPGVSSGPTFEPKPMLRQVNHPDGQHYFRKVGGTWLCDCGEQRDKNGRPIGGRR